jgi:RNA polymerase sigma-70 factor, ECF subfamily
LNALLSVSTTPQQIGDICAQLTPQWEWFETSTQVLNVACWNTMSAQVTPRHVESSDSSLIERLRRGDREALGVLYERYAADVKRVTWALLRDEAHADDAVQEVFLEAWKKADLFDASRGTVRAWLIVRARSRCLDRLRKRGRRAEVQWDGEGAHSQVSIEQHVDTVHLPRAFSCVNSEEREVLLLGYFEGLTSAEIAVRLDLPQGTVKSRTRTAMEKMREFWERGQK